MNVAYVGQYVDTGAVESFGLGFGFGLFCFTLAWGTLWLVHFVKTLFGWASP